MATFTGRSGTNESFVGTASADSFLFAVSDLDSLDSFAGNGGFDTLVLTSAGALSGNALSGMTGVERISLFGGGNSLFLNDNIFSGVANGQIQIVGGAGADAIDASGIANGAHAVDITAGGGIDTLVGGAGNDIFRFAAYTQLSGDKVRGNGGTDHVVLGTAGSLSVFDLFDVQGVEQFTLANGSNLIQLENVNFFGTVAGRIRVNGRTGADIIDGSRVDSLYTVEMRGGLGVDMLYGGDGDDLVVGTAADIAGDTIDGRAGFDTMQLVGAAQFAANGLADMRGIELIQLANGTNTLTLATANMAQVIGDRIAVVGGTGADTVDASAMAAPFSVQFTGGAGADIFLGGAGNDLIRSAASHLVGDSITGGAGRDTLAIATSTTSFAGILAGVQGVEIVTLADTGNQLALADANFAGIANGRIKVIGGTGNDGIDASALGSIHSVELLGGAGADTLRGGAGDDLFRTSASHLLGDTLRGNGGHDILSIESPAVQTANILARVQGIEEIKLADGPNRITLLDANFTGVTGARILLSGAAGEDIVNASALTGTRSLTIEANDGSDIVRSGAGDDRLTGGRGADLLAGGAGADHFVWLAPDEGGDVVLDFQDGTDRLELLGSGFGFDPLSFSTATQGDALSGIGTSDLFIFTGTLADAAAVRAMLDANGTGGADQSLVIVAANSAGHSIVYYTAFADGSGAVHQLADLGTGVAVSAINLNDFVIG